MKNFDFAILDREKAFAICLGDLLESRGATVYQASSYRDLLEVLYQKKAGKIICDLHQGVEVDNFLQRLKQIEHVPECVVFMSVFGDVSEWAGVKSLGMNPLVLIKPFQVKTLLSYIFPSGGVA